MNGLALRPGTVVATGIPWTPFYHVGIVADSVSNDGRPMIISNSQRNGGVAEESLTDFGDASTFRILGYWSELAPAEVLQRARQLVGTKWHLTNWNCEHFVRVAHAVKSESPQLKVGLTLVASAVVIIALLILTRRR